MLSKIFASLRPIENGLDASWLRNDVILNNIANVDTPNFKRSTVEFETLYKQSLESDGFTSRKTMPRHRDFSQSTDAVVGKVVQDNTTTTRMDGNNVDIDVETTEFARNYIYYLTLQSKINSEFSQLSMAIREGK